MPPPNRPAPTGAAPLCAPYLVGRANELDTLLQLTARPSAAAVIEGEPGVGKSRLVAECLARVRATGRRALLGRCHRLSEGFALGPVIEAVRGCDDLRLPPIPPGRQPQILALLDLLAAAGPTVCVLEDLQWADDLTLDFLSCASAQPPDGLVMVTTVRRGELADRSRLIPMTRWRAGGFLNLVLDPLSPEDTRQLVGAILGADRVSEQLATYVHERTAGIPFAIEEVVRLMQERGDVTHRAGRWMRRDLRLLDVPPAVRETVLERVSRLTVRAREAVEAAAVLGAPAGEALLHAVSDAPAARSQAALCEALRAGVLIDSGRGLYGFRHSLASQAVVEHLPTPRAQLLHRRAAAALELQRPRPLLHLVRHYREGGLIRRWMACAPTAARAALAAGDVGLAARVLREALESGEATPPQRRRLALALAEVAAADPHPDAVVHVLDQVARDQRLQPGERNRLTHHLALLVQLGGDASRARSMQGHLAAQDLRPQPDLMVRVMSSLACPWVLEGHESEHRRWLTEALLTAPVVPEVALEAQVAQACVLVALGDPAGWQVAAALPAASGSMASRRIRLHGALALAAAAFHTGHDARSELLLREAAGRAAEVCDPAVTAALETASLMRRWSTGRWTGLAEDAADHIVAMAAWPRLAAVGRRILAFLALAQGRVDEAERRFRDYGEVARVTGLIPAVAAASGGLTRTLLARGDVAGAMAAASDGWCVVASKGTWAWAAELAPAAAEAALTAGHRANAARLTGELATGLQGRDAPLAEAALGMCRGLLAEARRQHGEAAGCFAEAHARYAALPRPYEAARAAVAAGRAALAAGDPRGRDLLTAGLATMDVLGATADAAMGRRLARTQSRLDSGGRGGHGAELTPRELAVAELAAVGRTDAEIGRSLHLSPRTVEHYLASARGKLQVRSRTELAARWAARRSAAPPPAA